MGCTGRIPPSPPAIYELLRVTEIGTQVRGVTAGHFDYSRARGIARDGILQQATILLVAFPRQFGAGDGSVQQLHVMHHGQWMSDRKSVV